MNGFGGKSDFTTIKLFKMDPVYDFAFIDSFNVLVAGEDPEILQVDIRKGVIIK